MYLLQLWRNIRASLWFVPGLFVLLAVALAVALVQIDSYLNFDWLDDWPLLFGAGAAGARSLLATVASSMITVVGVVFSITIVALSMASSQYTPRVLRTFMRDTGNQLVLGAFVGIFAYCLVVLRTIRAGDEGAFVPPLAVLVGLALAFVGIGVLIYFIHHISTSIQAAHILANAAAETLRSIRRMFPKGIGDDDGEIVMEQDGTGRIWQTFAVPETGYLQSFDSDGLVGFAAKRQTVLRMEHKTGQFVIQGSPLASVLAAAAPDEAEREQIRSFVAIGRQRTIEQDAAFGIRQIVDVALKALSPGINDTTTAVMSVNYLTAILMELTQRRIECYCRGEDGEIRLLTGGPSYESFVAESFDQIRQNAAGNVVVLDTLLGTIEELTKRTSSSARLGVLAEQAEAMTELCVRSVPAPRDRERLKERSRRVSQLLAQEQSDVRRDTATSAS
jgi:uncharacterized membrane protein